MKKFVSMLVCLSMLLCIFSFTSTANAVYHPPATGETVSSSDVLSGPYGDVDVSFELTCWNGWLDGTYGSDFVSASMSATPTLASCAASISIQANYIQDGNYTSETDYESASSLSSMSLSIYPNSDLLSSGSATFNLSAGNDRVAEYLSASCPTATK